jgi:hypothetical protein
MNFQMSDKQEIQSASASAYVKRVHSLRLITPNASV